LAAEFGFHAGQFTAWKKQLLAGAAGLFEDGRSKRAAADAANDQELYEQIGRLKKEVEWLKKSAREDRRDHRRITRSVGRQRASPADLSHQGLSPLRGLYQAQAAYPPEDSPGEKAAIRLPDA
jgi:hypothetical protein